ncbi:MAG: signal recognition particle protein [bacterium (Candidatus Stahlbacteria) CG23_combo_of_CG06-09_8_20_14_all_34_7]|nr:MAG: signal recognition particle protein [bacterium (Candidatus Stahlbacteria) CG23_combo_of_CG06-09_8_20_14_all_34_7]
MLEGLTLKINKIFQNLKNKGHITDEDIKQTMREIRLVLLESDVNYLIVKDFIKAVEDDVRGKDVLKSLKPEHIIIKSVNDKMIEMLSAKDSNLHFKGNPAIVMLVGLQGTGKTTTAGKLSNLFKKQNRRTLLVPCDLKRPAAYEQLKQVAEKSNSAFFDKISDNLLVTIENSIMFAQNNNLDTLILDTAGRLHIDSELMDELMSIEKKFKPAEILYVGDSLTGQDAVNSAKGFCEKLNLTGTILTKMDGDQKGGAALSIVKITDKPIKFLCTGEHLDKIEEFYPERLVSRILGMGDIVSLVERTEKIVSKEKAEDLERKLMAGRFDFEDYLEQIKQIKKLGPLSEILRMIPGIGAKIKTTESEEKNLKKVESIISSMTKKERKNPLLLNNKSRVKRIASGSGTTVAMVKNVIFQHKNMKKMMNMFKKNGFNMRNFK